MKKFTEYKPEFEVFNETLSTQEKVIARNCLVGDLQILTGGTHLCGAWTGPNGQTVEKVLSACSSDGVRHIQLKAHSEDAMKVVQLALKQSGNDVTAKIESCRYCDPSSNIGNWVPENIPIAASAQDAGYGVAKLYFTTSTFQAFVANMVDAARTEFNRYLGTDYTTVAYNVRLADFEPIWGMLGGAWAPDTPASIVPGSLIRKESEMSLRLCATCSDYVKVVALTFRQDGNDIVAKIDWCAARPQYAGYARVSGLLQVAEAPIAESSEGAGYGVSHLVMKRASRVKVNMGVGMSAGGMGAMFVNVRTDLGASDVRIGLHYLNGTEYGGWICDKQANHNEDGSLSASFTVPEIADRVKDLEECPRMFSRLSSQRRVHMITRITVRVSTVPSRRPGWCFIFTRTRCRRSNTFARCGVDRTMDTIQVRNAAVGSRMPMSSLKGAWYASTGPILSGLMPSAVSRRCVRLSRPLKEPDIRARCF